MSAFDDEIRFWEEEQRRLADEQVRTKAAPPPVDVEQATRNTVAALNAVQTGDPAADAQARAAVLQKHPVSEATLPGNASEGAQTLAALADVTRNAAAMKQATGSTYTDTEFWKARMWALQNNIPVEQAFYETTGIMPAFKLAPVPGIPTFSGTYVIGRNTGTPQAVDAPATTTFNSPYVQNPLGAPQRGVGMTPEQRAQYDVARGPYQRGEMLGKTPVGRPISAQEAAVILGQRPAVATQSAFLPMSGTRPTAKVETPTMGTTGPTTAAMQQYEDYLGDLGRSEGVRGTRQPMPVSGSAMQDYEDYIDALIRSQRGQKADGRVNILPWEPGDAALEAEKVALAAELNRRATPTIGPAPPAMGVHQPTYPMPTGDGTMSILPTGPSTTTPFPTTPGPSTGTLPSPGGGLSPNPLEETFDPYTAYLTRLGLGGRSYLTPAERARAAQFDPLYNLYGLQGRLAVTPGGTVAAPGGSFSDYALGLSSVDATQRARDLLRSITGMSQEGRTQLGAGYDPTADIDEITGLPTGQINRGNIGELQRLVGTAARGTLGQPGARWLANVLPTAQDQYLGYQAAGGTDNFLDYLRQRYNIGF